MLAQEIAAANDLVVKRIGLERLVGRDGVKPKPLAPPVVLPPLQPNNVDDWVNQALDAHPVLRQSALALEVAQLETQKAKAGHLPTLDLTGSYNITQNNGSSSTTLDYRNNVFAVGLAFNLPLFAGYATQNRTQ